MARRSMRRTPARSSSISQRRIEIRAGTFACVPRWRLSASPASGEADARKRGGWADCLQNLERQAGGSAPPQPFAAKREGAPTRQMRRKRAKKTKNGQDTARFRQNRRAVYAIKVAAICVSCVCGRAGKGGDRHSVLFF